MHTRPIMHSHWNTFNRDAELSSMREHQNPPSPAAAITKPLGVETLGATLNMQFRTISAKSTSEIIAGADLMESDSFRPNSSAASRQIAHKRPENRLVLSPGIITT